MRVTAKDIAEALNAEGLCLESVHMSMWKFSRYSQTLNLRIWFTVYDNYPLRGPNLYIHPFKIHDRERVVYAMGDIKSLDRLKALDWEQIELDVFKKVCAC